jgi:hypothetical protein
LYISFRSFLPKFMYFSVPYMLDASSQLVICCIIVTLIGDLLIMKFLIRLVLPILLVLVPFTYKQFLCHTQTLFVALCELQTSHSTKSLYLLLIKHSL